MTCRDWESRQVCVCRGGAARRKTGEGEEGMCCEEGRGEEEKQASSGGTDAGQDRQLRYTITLSGAARGIRRASERIGAARALGQNKSDRAVLGKLPYRKPRNKTHHTVTHTCARARAFTGAGDEGEELRTSWATPLSVAVLPEHLACTLPAPHRHTCRRLLKRRVERKKKLETKTRACTGSAHRPCRPPMDTEHTSDGPRTRNDSPTSPARLYAIASAPSQAGSQLQHRLGYGTRQDL